MEYFLATISANDEFIHQWGYLVLFAAAWLEGLNTMIIGGVLASLGKLNPVALGLVMALGHMASGFTWYAIGFYGGHAALEKWGPRLGLTPKRLYRAEQYFERHGGKAVVVTKFTVGLTIAALIIAGTLKMRLKKFTAYNAAGSLIWAVLTVGIGYTFGLSFRLAAEYLESFTRLVIFSAIFASTAFALWYILRWMFRRRLTHVASTEE